MACLSIREAEGVGTLKINAQGLAMLKHFESCLKRTKRDTFEAYPDPGYGWDVATIGWGTVQYENGKQVRPGDEITQTRADELLAFEVAEKARGVANLVKVPLTENQASALIVFAYNVGLGALRTSTLLRRLNAKDYTGAAGEFSKWTRSNGQRLTGLVRRRTAERELFGKP